MNGPNNWGRLRRLIYNIIIMVLAIFAGASLFTGCTAPAASYYGYDPDGAFDKRTGLDVGKRYPHTGRRPHAHNFRRGFRRA